MPFYLADSWDSVTVQPCCEVCEMVFKSDAVLQRHLKYSELHAKLTNKTPTVTRKLSAAEELLRVEAHNASLGASMVYSGDKFFWRLQETVLFSLYARSDFNCLEVVSLLSGVNSMELPRLYLDLEVVTMISRREVLSKIDEREKRGEIVHAEEKATLLHGALASFVLARIHVRFEDGVHRCVYQPSVVDPVGKVQELPQPPKRMANVQAEQRRRSSIAEIERVMSDLAEHSDALQQATKEAARKLDVLKESGDRLVVMRSNSGAGSVVVVESENSTTTSKRPSFTPMKSASIEKMRSIDEEAVAVAPTKSSSRDEVIGKPFRV